LLAGRHFALAAYWGAMGQLNIFISAVSAEFGAYREALRRDLTRPGISVAIQEDFIPTGSETLDKLDDYVRHCDAVIHLVGDMCGAPAMSPSVAVIRERYRDFGERLPAVAPFLQPGAPALSYTQWEAWLALHHRRRLLICAPQADAIRDPRYRVDAAQQQAQQEHLARLAQVERYPEFHFASADRLAVEVLRSGLGDQLARAGAGPRNLPLGPSAHFTGRDTPMRAVEEVLGMPPQSAHEPARACVLTGLGGIGKTRLAVEYAWHRVADYSALLFADASSAEALERGLAALCAAAVLNLEARHDKDQSVLLDAVLHWFAAHPGWLLILDNADTEGAAAAVEALLPRLLGGHVLVTARVASWSGSVAPVPLHELDPTAAATFLLGRTQGGRRARDDDSAQAATIAKELGYLPLALEQAAAFVRQRKLSLADYLEQWQASRDTMLGWFDARLMAYPRSVAATWQTSFGQLSATARRLLQRLAWLDAEPIPESLLAQPVPGDAEGGAALAALAELAGYSLASCDDGAERFSVHRLVQEVTRAGMDDEARGTSLTQALVWLSDAFTGDPQDVRNWPHLDPLLPHVLRVAQHADPRGIADPTAQLMNHAGSLFHQKALHAQAEPLMRRALAIDEASYGQQHPSVAARLNNLAQLLQVTNRLAEAEPLMRRALAIDEASYGEQHPEVAIDLSNLSVLLQATDRLEEAEPLMRRALVIFSRSLGAEHPKTKIALGNYQGLLQALHIDPQPAIDALANEIAGA